MKRYCSLIFVIIIAILFSSCEDIDESNTLDPNEQLESITYQQETVITGEERVNNFIQDYNSVATTPISDATEVDVTDRDSGHYRTEFRLNAYSDSYAKTGTIGDIVVDIVSYSRKNEDIRIYVDGVNLEQAIEIIKTASPILDSTLSDADIQDTITYLSEHKSTAGYYFGKIGMLYNGENLMLKLE